MTEVGPLSAWLRLCGDFRKFAAKIASSTSVNINSEPLRQQAVDVARLYLQEARQTIKQHGFEEELKLLDDRFQKLYELAQGRNAVASYKKQITPVAKALPKITARLEMEVSTPKKPELSAIEIQISETLASLIPTAALSYQQAIRDLADTTRVSFRGSATELREVLREVLDHYAPDSDVEANDGYEPEKDQNGKDRPKPTMKQKVRFILKAREQSTSAAEMPERAAEAADALVGAFTRSVYNFGSVVTHVSGERQAIVVLKRYIEVVLGHLLEL